VVGGEIVSNRYSVHDPRLLLFLSSAQTITTIATAAMMNLRSNWSDSRTPITEILPQTDIVCQSKVLRLFRILAMAARSRVVCRGGL
jgi:hypothetical protein